MDDTKSILSYYCTEEYLNQYLGTFQINDRPKRMVYRFMNAENDVNRLTDNSDDTIKSISPKQFIQEDRRFPSRPCFEETIKSSSFKVHHPQHPASSNLSWKQTNNKYSHVQAKVQSHRKKSERSDSMRKKSPPNIKGPNKPHKENNTKDQYGVKPKVNSLSNLKHMPGGGDSKIFKEKLSFRQKAEPRTDTHGIGMYAHLPEEFQEIARRLARQDSQMRKQEIQRGRSTSRSRSVSRHSSASPNARGRSRTRRNKRITPGNSISDIFAAVNASKGQLDSPTKQNTSQNSLSRSSSIRSIPSTPHLSKLHPSTSFRQHPSSKSPSTSPKRSPGRHTANTNKFSTPSSSIKLKPDKPETSARTLELLSSPVSKLYQFTTQNESFGSPQCPSSIYQIIPAVR